MAIAPASAKWVGVTYSRADLENVARFAGFTGQDVTIAGAVAMAESSGRADAIGGPNTDGTYDYGEWQINSGAHPEKFVGRDWSNPATNAVMAHEVWAERNGGSWAPWSVFQSGAYEAYMPGGSKSGGDTGGGGGGGASGGSAASVADTVLGPLDEAGDALGAIGAMIFKAGVWLGDSANWLRVLQVVVGGGLTIAALTIVAKPAIGNLPGPVGKISKLVS